MTTFSITKIAEDPLYIEHAHYRQVLPRPSYYYTGEVDSGDVLTEKEPERWNDLELEEAAGGTPRRSG